MSGQAHEEDWDGMNCGTLWVLFDSLLGACGGMPSCYETAWGVSETRREAMKSIIVKIDGQAKGLAKDSER